MSKAKLMRSAAMAMALSGAFAGTAVAGDVLLKSKDGNIKVTGNLLDADGQNYVIRTAIGPLSVAKSRVVCEGENCLAEEDFTANFRILADGGVADNLLPLAFEGFAAWQAAGFDIRSSATDGFYGRFISDDGHGEETVKLKVSPASSADALRQLGEDMADVVFTTRQASPTEARDLRAKLGKRIAGSKQEIVIGQETLSAIVHPESPISEIGIQQLRDVFQGKITNWAELGGPDAKINIVRKSSDDLPGAMVKELLLDGEGHELDATTMVGASDEDISMRVSDDPYAIALVSLSAVRGAKPLGLVSECGVISQPSEFHAKAGDYPLSRPIMMYHGDALDNEHMSSFLAYTKTEDFANLVEKAGYVSSSIEAQQIGLGLPSVESGTLDASDRYEGEALASFASEFADLSRLSATFQFRMGSSYLDANGMEDMKHLVEYLAQQPKGTTVTFVGFSDSVGPSEKNRLLSLKRAKRIESLAREMMPGDQADQIEFASKGYGEIRPRACNTSLEGRDLNRRVEVWISSQTPS